MQWSPSVKPAFVQKHSYDPDLFCYVGFCGPTTGSPMDIGNSKPSPSVPHEFVVFAEGEDEDKDGADDVEVVWQDKESKQSVACILELLADQDPEWKCVEHEEEEQPEQLGNPQ